MIRSTLVSLLLLPTLLLADAPVRFRTEVMAVLSRGGCNSGPCHGNLNGKGGFKLSLRGEDAEADFLTITRGMLGRRIDRADPRASLLLAKATMRHAHEGGLRFAAGSHEADILRRWISEGARLEETSIPRPVRLQVSPSSIIVRDPDDRVRLQVKATLSNGTVRDVTHLACFEPSNLLVKVDGSGEVTRLNHGESTVVVRYLETQAVARIAFVPDRPGFVWREVPEHNYIDRHIFARLRDLKIQPAELCTDEEFVRRAYLDTIGLLPTPDETRDFLADSRGDKRRRLIEKLVARNEFADFWALKWSDLLRNEEKVLDARGVRHFHGWIRQAIIDNRPLNEFAQDLVASRGSTYSKPAANFYRALRDPYARAEATAQVFLGVRLQCARCHNHPFDRWTQNDYHRFAAFFARVQYRIVENRRTDMLDKHEFDGEQIVYQDRAGELKHPVTGETLAPAFLGTATPALAADADRLTPLAAWIADRENPFFARVQVNRIWQHLIGRGLVDPGDDFRDSNPPSHPELLEALARDFVEHRFDLKQMVRTIMGSRVYQLAARPTDLDRDEEATFARGIIRPLQAEQLLDAVTQVSGSSLRFEGFPAGTRAGQLPGVFSQRRRGRRLGEAERFLSVFGKPVRSLSCECERTDETTLARAFQLLTGPLLDRMLRDSDNRLGRLLASGKTNAAILEELYLAALCRRPTSRELERAEAMLASTGDRRAVFEDVLWGLMNAKEFLLRR